MNSHRTKTPTLATRKRGPNAANDGDRADPSTCITVNPKKASKPPPRLRTVKSQVRAKRRAERISAQATPRKTRIPLRSASFNGVSAGLGPPP